MIDLNAYIGNWPFYQLEYNTPEKLIQLMDRAGIEKAFVTPLDGVFYNSPHEANIKWYDELQKFSDRLIQVAVISPAYEGWQDDFLECAKDMKLKALKIFPCHHDYNVQAGCLKELMDQCYEYKMPVMVQTGIEDVRQRTKLDVRANVGYRDFYNIIMAQPKNTYILQNCGWDLINAITGTLPFEYYDYYFDLNYVFGPILDDIEKVYERLTPNRIVFGTSMPFRYPETNILKVKHTLDDIAGQEKIFSGNAKKIFSL